MGDAASPNQQAPVRNRFRHKRLCGLRGSVRRENILSRFDIAFEPSQDHLSYTIIDHVVYGADEVVKVRGRPVPLPPRRRLALHGARCHSQRPSRRGVAFHCFRAHDLEISIASGHAHVGLEKTFARLYAYPFRQLGVARITCITGRKNKPVRRLARLGASTGAPRRGWDAMSYGLLRDDCRWLQYIWEAGGKADAVCPAAPDPYKTAEARTAQHPRPPRPIPTWATQTSAVHSAM